MKRLFIILISAAVFLGACKKEATVRTSGTDTIDNVKYHAISYHVYGFSFSQAKLVATNATPPPDIMVNFVYSDDAPPRPTLQTNNFHPSFYKLGEYDTEDEAKEAFDDFMKNSNIMVELPGSFEDIADPIAPNQIWLYMNNAKYTKIRIVEVIIDKLEGLVDYVECTFEWVHQPDGRLSFP